MTSDKQCSTTELQWKENQPFSSQYDDIYFSKRDGLNETRHVFLDSNNLTKRFEKLDSDTFCIAETGFGTGLNFLCAWQLWHKKAPDNARLNFISAERFPLTIEDLSKALKLWPELAQLSEQLLAQYPHPAPGYHRLSFDNGRVTLTLMLGDAAQCYSQLDACVDAWLLDGFSPPKNPDMWHPELFQQVARLSRPGTTFATFTVAGVVKRGLNAVGFEVKRAPGIGLKKEIQIGTFTQKTSAQQDPTGTLIQQEATGSFIQKEASDTAIEQKAVKEHPAWFRLPAKHPQEKTALIIGAGIAGCSTAYSLATRGWQVTLIDRHKVIAQEGSGNRQGALYAKLPVKPIPASRIHLAGFLHSSRFLQQHLPDERNIWDPCGLIQIPGNEKNRQRQQDLIDSENYPTSVISSVSREKASTLAGVPLTDGGLYFPDAGWVTPPLLCEWLCEHPNISLIMNTDVKQIKQDDETKHWQALGLTNVQTNEPSNEQEGPIATAAVAVVTSAADSMKFDQLNHLPLQSIRGQVSIAPATEDTPKLQTVLCGEGYISPPKEGKYCFGATFDLKDECRDIRAEGHEHNIAKIYDIAPEFADSLINTTTTAQMSGRVGFRCASPDYLPVIGPAPVFEAFIEDYAKLRKDRKTQIKTSPQHYPGLFINVAHGSKGLITGAISGEIIASMLEQEPLPLETELIDALNPARFIIKKLIKRAI